MARLPVVTVIRTVDRLESVLTSIRTVTKNAVYAGVPQESTNREADDSGKQPEINNATIAYIMEHGSPLQNIPARPFLKPAIKDIQPQIRETLRAATKATLNGDAGASERALNKVGMMAVKAIQAKITDGPFEPLSPRTIEARLRRRLKGQKLIAAVGASEAVKRQIAIANRQATGQAIVGTKPLIDTGQLRRSINYVIKAR